MKIDVLKTDAVEFLRCPQCRENTLVLNDISLTCSACGSQYPVDVEKGLCSLLVQSDDSQINKDIRKWWGDLYQQLYAENDSTLDQDKLARQLIDLEEMFHLRDHLATNEMPLDQLPGKTVLEIGPGAGAHSALFASKDANVVAVDMTPERVMSSDAKLSLINDATGRAYQADAGNLPFRDNCFDIVYSNGVLHHAEDTDACIDEVFRVLKPGGRAVLMLYSRHSSIYWLQVLPRAILTGEFFRWPEAQWMGRLTEGKPKHGETKNPITRVYSADQLAKLLSRFLIISLRKSSFQFDNFCVPRLTQIRAWVMQKLGYQAHAGGIPVYGAPFVPESRTELIIGKFAGFAWNIVAEKPINND